MVIFKLFRIFNTTQIFIEYPLYTCCVERCLRCVKSYYRFNLNISSKCCKIICKLGSFLLTFEMFVLFQHIYFNFYLWFFYKGWRFTWRGSSAGGCDSAYYNSSHTSSVCWPSCSVSSSLLHYTGMNGLHRCVSVHVTCNYS